MKNEILIEKNTNYPSAKIIFDSLEYSAVIGKNGVTTVNEKVEGDWKTPLGSYKILAIYYRPDKVQKPVTDLPLKTIESDDIWVDDSASELYNQPAKINDIEPGVSHEKLFRDDHLYDIFLDLGYNREPAVPGKGSAIFFHVARNEVNPSETPTAGCIATDKKSLLNIITKINEDTLVTITD